MVGTANGLIVKPRTTSPAAFAAFTRTRTLLSSVGVHPESSPVIGSISIPVGPLIREYVTSGPSVSIVAEYDVPTTALGSGEVVANAGGVLTTIVAVVEDSVPLSATNVTVTGSMGS